MIDFEKAVNYVLSKEGGLSENPRDPGGTTKYGISLRFLKGIENPRTYGIHSPEINAEDVIRLNEDQAKTIYKGEFWDKAPFERITSQTIGNYLFDAAINMGIANAIKCAQRSCWAVLGKRDCIKDDGILGINTIEMINHCKFYLMPALRSERAAYYKAIVASNPEQKTFIEGWLNRAYE